MLKRIIKSGFVLLLFLCWRQDWAEAQGIACDGTTDNAPYLNSLKLTGGHLVFTPGCVAALKSTWNITNQQSFTIDGQVRCGLPAACPHLKWLGPAGGTVLNMSNVQGVLVENLAFDGAGLAAKGVIVDETSPVLVNTYDVIFQGDEFDGNYPGSGAPNPNWVGLSVSPVSRGDVADVRVVDSSFACRGTGTGSGTIGYAQGLTNHSQNALQNVIRHDNFTACGTASTRIAAGQSLRRTPLAATPTLLMTSSWAGAPRDRNGSHETGPKRSTARTISFSGLTPRLERRLKSPPTRFR